MSAKPSELLERVLAGESLDEPTAAALLTTMATGELPPALAGALLVALRAKGETAEEIRGFALGMRALALKPHIEPGPYVDVVGTGGDGSHSLNLSTGSALLAAACGVPVVKHGNRSVSSRCGSADVLAALGLPIPLDERAAGERSLSSAITSKRSRTRRGGRAVRCARRASFASLSSARARCTRARLASAMRSRNVTPRAPGRTRRRAP